ncbi:Uncharacterised protein [Slackia heliotrinireducens]|uniref:Uncharacterized protein n=1 Tax=Slackia heliotrinireducens (strain ATCC 29202 / DSM 20476 / NCTC 11029 / RHS 1) TaxID=471855 RepID=C7N697_SLAHD|nr:hypothetical protein [Slackia heliotrinireducens]ACV22432.1 hypothetical protein Shel_14110 [Slackia heliotrinireducens DSM 20476]VEH00777.1 Uncharacterised protein [Slackia heliotrinireducens]
MSNDFFNNHPFLGGMFDLDRDGSLDLGEAAFMGGMGAMFASEMERSTREAERESYPWDDDDDEYDEFGNRKRKKRRSDDPWDDDYDSEDDDW